MIVAGFGFRKGALHSSFADALAQACGAHTPAAFATLDDKTDGLRDFAHGHDIPLIAVAPGAAQSRPTLTQSSASQSHKSTGSVAEATALVAAGSNARLAGPRSISTDRMATCAIAIGDTQ